MKDVQSVRGVWGWISFAVEGKRKSISFFGLKVEGPVWRPAGLGSLQNWKLALIQWDFSIVVNTEAMFEVRYGCPFHLLKMIWCFAISMSPWWIPFLDLITRHISICNFLFCFQGVYSNRCCILRLKQYLIPWYVGLFSSFASLASKHLVLFSNA